MNIILSVLTIAMGHYLWNCLRDTCTTKKSKDVIAYETQKYKEMMDDVLASSVPPPPSPDSSFLSTEEREQMVKELRELATFPDE